jgi:hypothetical protein
VNSPLRTSETVRLALLIRWAMVGPAPDEDTDHFGYEVPQQRLVHSVTVGESPQNGRTSSHS